MKEKWWKEQIIYQIYPKSFKDSNGDGVGDLKGIIEKLDYLKDLGITCIWICPIYKSPQDDCGYDISDYRDIDPSFGTLDDFKLLLEKAHESGIKVLMDLVVNHTSDEHPWFIESRKSKDNPYRDYYIWKDGKENGNPPSDWGSHFSGSAWEYDETTEQYYLHLFSKKQPDLNWENPKVRQEIYEMMKFWCDLGIDGYRMDTVCMYSKHLDFPDTGVKNKLAEEYFNDGPRMHEFLQEMNTEVLSKYDVMTVGEANGLTPEIAAKYIRDDRNELNTVFWFDHMLLDRKNDRWLRNETNNLELKKVFSKWQIELEEHEGWNSIYFSNHDQPRQISKFGNLKYWEKSGKMLATLIHSLQGVPYVYQGEEIGMTNCDFEKNEYRDVEIINLYNEYEENNKSIEEILPSLKLNNRDNSRTPIQWNNSMNAGFSNSIPWIKTNENYKEINVESQEKDENSILNYYKKIIRIRKENKVWVYGSFKEYNENDPNIYCYTRTYNDEKLIVIINLSEEKVEYKVDNGIDLNKFKFSIGNYDEMKLDSKMEIPPYGAFVWSL